MNTMLDIQIFGRWKHGVTLIKEHLNTRTPSFHKHLIKCKNNGNNFSLKIEAIVLNVGNLRINEALLIAKLHPQINTRLELNTENII